MSSLLPVHAAEHIEDGLTEYLTTSFSLADATTAGRLAEFLTAPNSGMFHGPYVRTRLPYAPATNWQGLLGWLPKDFVPYRHQAQAFERLASVRDGVPRRPDPTLVVTGTGSGKTESFLYPILDHCRRNPGPGIKALLLYPMNALANDQAERLASLISAHPELAGVTAGIYTGDQAGKSGTKVTAKSLITDRHTIRASPPDILLTNYKMLDQLLIRELDRGMWEKSATSLQYLVLDEFHTYDGAQGTDVALLLRRLGLMLKKHQPANFLAGLPLAQDQPLGAVTPVATSATLGSEGDSSSMLAFAHTIFGERLAVDAVVGETKQTIPQWQATVADVVGSPVKRRRDLPTAAEIAEINAEIAQLISAGSTLEDSVHEVFCRQVYGCQSTDLIAALAAYAQHPLTIAVLEHAAQAHPMAKHSPADGPSLVELILDQETQRLPGDGAAEFLAHTLTEIAYLRAEFGRIRGGWEGKKLPGVETHLWVRELSRIDRVVSSDATDSFFRWSDDGPREANPDAADAWLPACYCRNCGRSGWMIALQPGDDSPEINPQNIRRGSMTAAKRQRPLIDATPELRGGLDGTVQNLAGRGRATDDDSRVLWLDMRLPAMSSSQPTDEALDSGLVVPVLTYAGDNQDELADAGACPSCGETDAIRYLGSSVATLLSVALSNLFGLESLSDREKKTLVFTDSVQDAAHRAGFVQARARTFALRTLLRQAVGSDAVTLASLPDRLLTMAKDDPRARYELLPPQIAEFPGFQPYWSPSATAGERRRAAKKVADRLALDVALEFGDRADLARSLVSTGTLTASVDVDDAVLNAAADAALQGITLPLDTVDSLAWAWGIVEIIRVRGGINHKWFRAYLHDDCNAFHLNRRNSRAQGMPGFAKGGAPEFPRAGKPLKRAAKGADSTMPTASPRGTFARWSARALGITTHDAATAVTALMKELARRGVLGSVETSTAATVFFLSPDNIVVLAEETTEALECGVCRSRLGVPAHVRQVLVGSPCLSTGCLGTHEVVGVEGNYYRRLYSTTNTRTVVSREHTSLLDDQDRFRLEQQFKAEQTDSPDAPNVLIATPTLEMGIDIGDLSTVMLASLPHTVASYLQRVGRAGRLTGNSLIIALIRGRGMALPALEKPLSMIAGSVAAPAAFLSAQEILHRQFTAYLLDRLRLSEKMASPSRARDVFFSSPSSSAVTVIDVLTDVIEGGLDHQLDEFCSTLQGHTGDAVLAELRSWASGQGPKSLSGDLVEARQRWNDLEKELTHKQSVLETRDQQLHKQQQAPGADDDTKAQARSTKAALRFIRKQLSETVNGDYWISSMERYGLLPNFTLLDDAVELQLSVTFMQPDTLEFDTRRVDYSRGISSALFELAPGATFYAQGIAATIDSVELGAEGSTVEKWRLCPSCSYSRIEATSPAAKAISGACPECGDPQFADLNQLIDVVQMKKVFAEVEQTRSAINDRRDDRNQMRFHSTLSAVVPEGGAGQSWYLSGSGFGVQHLPRVELRWLNLGKGPGEKRMLAAQESDAPLFRVCRHCGHIDSEAGSNRWQDHRPWCRLRTAAEEETIAFALGRTLSTQGVRLFLPQLLTVADTLTVPSVIAAIKLGFKEVLGGDPTHLEVATVRLGSGDTASDALLLHDQVPGGTGYLTQFTQVEDVRSLLTKAYTRVRDCACALDDRRSCPECLLPYAPRGQEESTSRAAAEAALAKLLCDDLHPGEDRDPLVDHWSANIIEHKPETSSRSKLEALFLNQFRATLSTRDVALTKQVRGGRSEWTFSFPQQPHTWRMREQVDFGHTRPDFYLDTDDPNLRDIAIFLDGAAFHISQVNERVHGDVLKRNRLYDEGILPWSMTWADIEKHRAADAHAVPDFPVWFKQPLQPKIASMLNLASARLGTIILDPLSQLLAVLADPAPEQWEKISLAVALHAVTGASDNRAQYLNGVEVTLVGQQSHLQLSSDGGQINQAAWNLFLSLANLFYLHPDNARITSERTSQVEATVIEAGVDKHTDVGVDEAALPSAWQEAIAEYDDEPQVLAALERLALAGVAAPSSFGEEIASVMTIVAWSDRNLVVVYPEDAQALADTSWQAYGIDSLIDGALSPAFHSARTEHSNPDPWHEVIADFDDEPQVHSALEKLARAGISLPDSTGEEISSVMTIATWTKQQLAIVYPGGESDLTDTQWTPVDVSLIVDGPLPASFQAVAGTEENEN
ncbi:DEAD/DEAH box helicase [Corynebacterium alimapuense]|uniref:DEAD/DEAH box helicase n=1 Tax=Corynebacterium alimapuense TaxID=1576874 RepID=A0A3M8K804_9CORY|nr:DEAD/DEAH box helicase [Corynebacterium alimapuense]RNE49367.1 hypothetical protein C5L39_03095 [Corynebacterium alimapuense]